MDKIAWHAWKYQIIFDLIGCVSSGCIISYNNKKRPINMQDSVSFPQRQTRRIEIARITAFDRLHHPRDSLRCCIWCGKISPFLRISCFLRITRRISDRSLSSSHLRLRVRRFPEKAFHSHHRKHLGPRH